jgi:hypothetical protein
VALPIGLRGYHKDGLAGAVILDRVELDARADGAENLSMTEEMFRVVLETANAKSDKDGWNTLPEGRMMTLYVAHHGVQLTVAKVEALRSASSIVRARTSKGDTFLMALDDIFATALDAGSESHAARKAGFLG